MAPPDLFVVKNFLEPVVCDRIAAEMRAVQGSAAIVYGRGQSGAIDANVRKTLRVTPSSETVGFVIERLLSCKPDLEKHFAVVLNECEEPQFLRYSEGDFFVAHQDGNTGLLRLDTESRLISTIIILSRESDVPEPNTYAGGSLVFTDLRAPLAENKFKLVAESGSLVAFRSETTHEVTPVTRGERLSIVSWFR